VDDPDVVLLDFWVLELVDWLPPESAAKKPPSLLELLELERLMVA